MSRKIKLLIALLVVGTLSAYVIFVTIPTQMATRSYQAAKTLGEDIRKAFQVTPEITVNNTIVLNQQTSVFELSVLSQNFQHHFTWEHSWLGSTKKIFIVGSFDARVGFDLHQKFAIDLKDDKAYVTLPQPQALSVESLGDIIYRDEHGVWNWVNMENRTRATNAFIRDARRYANQAAFLDDAKKEVEERLAELLKPYAREIDVRYAPAATLRGK